MLESVKTKVDAFLEERQGRMVCPPKEKNTFEGLEAVAKMVDAKGCFFRRGKSHQKEKEIRQFLDGCEEEDFPFGEFSSAQLLVAPPVEVDASECDDSECDDESCDKRESSDEKDTMNQETNEAIHSQDEEREEEVPTIAGPEEIRAGCVQLVEELPESFREDIRKDAEALATLSKRLCPNAPWLTMRLEIVQEHMCSRWHQDHYISRSLITYVGPGTCGADDAFVRWDEFPKTAEDPTNESVVPQKGMTQMPTNAVLLIKGDSWPGIRGKGLTHKSPTDHGEGPPPKRLLLKVDLHNVRPLLADDDDPFLVDDDDDDEDRDSEDGDDYDSEEDEAEAEAVHQEEKKEEEEETNKRRRESDDDAPSASTKIAKVDS